MDTRTKTTKLYRAANVSRGEAIDALMTYLTAEMPGASLSAFEQEGRQYVATIKAAEFPPKEDDGGSDDSGGEESAPPKKSEGDDSGSDDDSDDGGDGAPDFGGGDEDGDEGLHGKPKVSLDEVVNLLHQVLQAVHGGKPGMHDPLDAGLDPMGGPPVPPGPPGAGGPPGHGAPLPPPVPHPKQGLPGGAFAHVASLNRKVAGRRSFATLRVDAHEIDDATAVAEAKDIFPGYRVAKIVRQGTVEVEGNVVDLAKQNLIAMAFVAE